MKLLYLVKQFPCLSQTFIRNEIRYLLSAGQDVYVASALRLDEAGVEPNEELAARTIYLEYDSIYRYAASGKHDTASIRSLAEEALAEADGTSSLAERRRLHAEAVSLEDTRENADRLFLEAVRLLSFIREREIERVHCDFAEENVGLAYLLNRATGVPFTFKMRAYDIYAEPQAALRSWASAAQRVLTISQYNRRYLTTRLGIESSKVSVNYDGIALDEIEPVADYRARPFRIASVSRLVEKKGYPKLLEACSLLTDRGLLFEVDIYGEGPMLGSLLELSRELGLETIVNLAGSRSRRALLVALESASVFVLPCIQARNGDRDGTPNALMEAMAREIPVISTRLSGIPEVIEHGVDGLLVEPGDARQLADAIESIHRDRALADRLRRNGRRKIDSRFRIERTVGELVQLFRDEV